MNQHKFVIEPRWDQGCDVYVYCDGARGTRINEALAREQRKIHCLHCAAIIDLYRTGVVEVRRRRGAR